MKAGVDSPGSVNVILRNGEFAGSGRNVAKRPFILCVDIRRLSLQVGVNPVEDLTDFLNFRTYKQEFYLDKKRRHL